MNFKFNKEEGVMEQVQLQNEYFGALESSKAVPKRTKFLVVEDDIGVQLMWERMIDAVDPEATILWATTEEGAEILIRDEARSGNDFDIVVADVMLAGKKTGIDLWKRYGNGNLQFLFVSGIGRKKFNELLGKGNLEHPYLLQKPLNPSDCIVCLRAMLSGSGF
jgi:hypothetical protein